MIDLLIAKINDTQFLITLFTAIAAAATVFTLGMPLVAGNDLNRRMKAVALERDKIRARERERLARADQRGTLRREGPKPFMKRIVEGLNLARHLGTDDAREKLLMAGYRGTGPQTVFLFFRMVVPIVTVLVAIFYLFVLSVFDQPPLVKVGITIFAAYIGIKLPELYISNKIQKRQQSIRRAFPDALDLMLICVDSGMSIEAAFRKVSEEIGEQSIELAEELILTTAEMSYLQDRRSAYENFGKRTGLEGVKAVCAALIQAEKYGTPVGQAMRVMAQENRDIRMSEAEKKAAGLPPKLTVPMILFFLPVLFIVILGPAAIRVMALP